MPVLSIIVPCYNEESALPYFIAEIYRVTEQMQQTESNLAFEFLFVDDGSQDGTLNLLRSYAAEDKRVRYLSFSRNFGKEAAMYAGLEHAWRLCRRNGCRYAGPFRFVTGNVCGPSKWDI